MFVWLCDKSCEPAICKIVLSLHVHVKEISPSIFNIFLSYFLLLPIATVSCNFSVFFINALSALFSLFCVPYVCTPARLFWEHFGVGKVPIMFSVWYFFKERTIYQEALFSLIFPFVFLSCSTSRVTVIKTLLSRTLSCPYYDAVTSGSIPGAGTDTYPCEWSSTGVSQVRLVPFNVEYYRLIAFVSFCHLYRELSI